MILDIISLIIVVGGGIVVILNIKRINKALWMASRSVPLYPNSKEFDKLLNEIKTLDLESRLKIIQVSLGGEIQIVLTMDRNKIIVTGAAVSGEEVPTVDGKQYG